MPLFGAFGGAAGHGLEPGNFPLFCTPCFSCKRMVGPAYGPFGSRNCARRSDIPPFLQIFSWLQAVFDLRLPILQRSFTKFYSMMHSPDLVGMSRLTYMGQPVFAGRTRNETRPDFISCFALHIEECEQTGRNGSTANYRMAYRMLLRYAGGGKLPPEQFTAEWLERYERWLLARGLGTNTVVFHMRYLRAVYNRAADKGIFSAINGNPFFRRHIKQVATRKRALPRETLKRISDADLSALHSFLRSVVKAGGMDVSPLEELSLIHISEPTRRS